MAEKPVPDWPDVMSQSGRKTWPCWPDPLAICSKSIAELIFEHVHDGHAFLFHGVTCFQELSNTKMAEKAVNCIENFV
ncbi:MAG: hypothetical protein II152_07550, partial [Succinivibrionaceae bacterium]|nr:hypothetical protein [Succinivibrionaceae bacterium]